MSSTRSMITQSNRRKTKFDKNDESQFSEELIEMKKVLRIMKLQKDMTITNSSRLKIIDENFNRRTKSFAFTHDSKYIASGCENYSVAIFNLEMLDQGIEAKTIIGTIGMGVLSLVFSPISYSLITLIEENNVYIWPDVLTPENQENYNLSAEENANFLAVSPNGKYLAIGYDQGLIQVFSLETRLVTICSFNQSSQQGPVIKSLIFTSDSTCLISGCDQGFIKAWSLRRKALKFKLKKHSKEILYFDIGKKYEHKQQSNINGDLLVSCCEDEIRLWDLETKTIYYKQKKDKFQFSSISLSYDREILAVGYAGTSKIDFINIENMKLESKMEGNQNTISTLIFTKDGKYLAIADHNKILLQVLTYQADIIQESQTSILNICMSNDMKNLASVIDGQVVIKDFTLENSYKTIETGESKVMAIAFSSNSKYIALGLEDGGVVVYDFDYDLKEVMRLKFEFKVYDIAFTKDNNKVILTQNKSLKVIEINTGKIEIYDKHYDEILCLAVSDDWIISGGLDNNLIFWKYIDDNSIILPNDNEVPLSEHEENIAKKLEFVCAINAHTTPITAVAIYSPSILSITQKNNPISLAATGSADSQIILWRLDQKSKEFIIEKNSDHAGSIRFISFSQDGNFFASTSESDSIKIWNIKEKYMILTIKETYPNLKGYISSDYSIISSSGTCIKSWNWKNPTGVRVNKNNKIVKTALMSPCMKFCTFTYETNETEILYLKPEQKMIPNSQQIIIQRVTRPMVNFSALYNPLFQNFINFNNLINCIQSNDYKSLSLNSLSCTISEYGYTGLHIAAFKGISTILEDLLQKQTIPLRVDSFGHSPLFYSIERQQHRCADILIKYLIKLSLNPDQTLFLMSIHSIRNDLALIIKGSSVHLQSFFDVCLYTPLDSTHFGSPLSEFPMVLLKTSSIALDSDFISDNKTNRMPLKLLRSHFPFSGNSCTVSNTKLLNSIIQCENEDIFRSEFIQYFILQKWNSSFLLIYAITGLLWVNLALVVISFQLPEMYLVDFCSVLALFNSILFFIELAQIKSLRWDYVKDVWNWIDMLGIYITYVFIVAVLYGGIEVYSLLKWLVIALNFIKGLTGFRAFESTRYYVKLIIQSLYDIKSFIGIFIYTVFCFGLLNIVSNKSEINFYNLFISPLAFTVGKIEEFNLLGNDDNYSLVGHYLTIILAVIISIILMLNLIISILENSFDEFQFKETIYNFQEMAQVVLEIELIKIIFMKTQGEEQYLHICTKANTNENSSWSGKVLDIRECIQQGSAKMKKKVSLINQSLQIINQEIDENTQATEKKLRKIDLRLTEYLSSIGVQQERLSFMP
ncbi:hypothetical protein SteCoe_14051 [Stentor coeruleus]|uniref:Ion transport domain-containing protein n=1 Tax=Stentor coeruleus TaxID=5963 RepID=A0A1R2C789_9CILI|nr:hypothetical protein SteCoe_14051 [Stentor coeruleus]